MVWKTTHIVFALLNLMVSSTNGAGNYDEWDMMNTTTSLISDDSSLQTRAPSNGSATVSSTEMNNYPSTTTTEVHTRSREESGNDIAKNLAFAWYPISWTWVPILQLISAIIGIVGNLLVIVVLFQRRRKSRSTDTLIGGLACADFLTSVFLVPTPWPWIIPRTWLGEVYCRLIITQSLLWASITASTYILMSISVERYIAIVYPLHFRHLFTRRRVSIFICIIWLLSVLSGLFAFIIYGVDEENQCGEQYTFVHAQTIIAYYWFCLRLAIPCLTMLGTQILIARKLSHDSRRFKGITNATKEKQAPSFHIVARNRVLKMMLIVIFIYIVCWTPNQIAYMGYNLGWVPKSYLRSTLHRFLTVLGFYNSCANPVIYAARYPEFRQALRDMFTCTSPQNTPLFEKGDISKNSFKGEAKFNKV